MPDAASQVPLTELLDAWRSGDGQAFESLINATHAQLRQMADERMRRAGPMTLAPQDLLNEAVLRLLESPPDLRNRSHFFATVSLLMRSIVVDFARARAADKRGGGAARVTFTESIDAEGADAFEVLALDDALKRLALVDPRGSDVLHLTYFAGLKQDQVAELLKVSVKTIERDLRFSRAWLEQAMSGV
jgi:RNA polymerase sigma factor (TIGR02999 family)